MRKRKSSPDLIAKSTFSPFFTPISAVYSGITSRGSVASYPRTVLMKGMMKAVLVASSVSIIGLRSFTFAARVSMLCAILTGGSFANSGG
nr:MAG TPA: hypothetical protein [Siphoviridae sp. ctS248]